MVPFGHGEWHRRGKLELLEVVAICDYLVAFSVDHAVVAADEEDLPDDARNEDDCRQFNLLCDYGLPLLVLSELRNHHPKNLQVALWPDDWIGLVLRPQHNTAFLAVKSLQREFVVQHRDDDVSDIRRRVFFDDDHITRLNAGVDHGVALDGDEHGAGGMADQLLIDA